jgi:broad specificity phosphatase PhoE
MKDVMEKLEAELADWRTKLDTLRVRAHLGKMELKDKEREMLEAFEPAYDQARKKLGEAVAGGGERAAALAKGLDSGWKELRKTYKEVLASRKG